MTAHRHEYALRCRWTLSRLGELINEARAIGWLSGSAIEDIETSTSFSFESRADTPMCHLEKRLALSRQQIDTLWLLACIELEPALSSAARNLIGGGMTELSVQIVEQLIAVDEPFEQDALAHLSRLGLIETTSDQRTPLFRRPIRVSDRVLDLVRGRLSLDASLGHVATLHPQGSQQIEVLVPRELQRPFPPGVAIVAMGQAGAGKTSLLKRVASDHGYASLAIAGAMLPTDDSELRRCLRAIARECQLHNAWPLVQDAEALRDRMPIVERELLQGLSQPLLATTREPWSWPCSRTLFQTRVSMPTVEERQALWSAAMPRASSAVIQDCAQRYAISPAAIMRSGTTATTIVGEGAQVSTSDVQSVLRAQFEKELAGVARRVETRQTWDDLVLPVDQFDSLIEMVARVRHRHLVLEDWGFADKVGRGIGMSALLSGPPGTGKTMVAGLVAKELGLDLFQVDLSKVVSKYIGETEKQLASLFDAAESGHAILLFDEADSLFAKRTEVKSSNDRYANLEVNYLLQRIEAFSGITMLTTNHETAIDSAFMRRLAFHVRVPMPDEKQRELLWAAMLPNKAKCAEDLDFGALADQFAMSGGYIKNAVLRAAFLSAEEGTAITHEHLLRAARAEYSAMGKLAYEVSA